MEGVSTLERPSRLDGHVPETYGTLRRLYGMKRTGFVTFACVAKTLRTFFGVRLTPRPRHVLTVEEKEIADGALEGCPPRTEEIESHPDT